MNEPTESFAAKLSHLIATVHPPDRPPYSYREIEAGIKDIGGTTISAAFIHQLAKGKRQPGLAAAQVLAQFFGVPVDYFSDSETTEKINQQLADLARWRDSEARATAERIMSLGPRDRSTVANLLDSLEQYEAQPREQRRRRKATSRHEP